MAGPSLFLALKAFIERDGKVLILREAASYEDAANVGRFDVPGGRLKAGERFDEALKREVREETGLEVEVGQPFFLNEWRPIVRGEQWQIVGTFVRCTSRVGDVTLQQDHDAFEWIDPRTHCDHPLIEELHSAFEAYLA